MPEPLTDPLPEPASDTVRVGVTVVAVAVNLSIR
jgi:hypothetical protein